VTLAWALALLAMTVALLGARPYLDKAHIALLYVLLVLLASARAGRRIGLALCVGAFICFNYFFLPPYHTLRVAEPIDWLVLGSFLVVSAVAAQLLTRAREEADAAQARASEIDRLSAERLRLVAETEHVDALREADALKDALLASVSHDLRTPLTTIKALAHAIGQEGDERAATIEEEADRLNRVVTDLLDLSRLAGGALQLTPEINAADDLLGAALQQVSGHAGGREVTVLVDQAGPMLVGRFDFVHALRIVVNLLENAFKYTPAATPIELAARGGQGALEIEVADRGPGIPAGDRARIFEAFYRPAGHRPDGRSAGLGLSIARQLAEAQGGSLQYQPRDGGGSRFILRLPAADIGDIPAGGSSL
jgi:K+-sensing histidine kinase KdpD